MSFSVSTPFKRNLSQRFITVSCHLTVQQPPKSKLIGSVNWGWTLKITGGMSLLIKFTQAQLVHVSHSELQFKVLFGIHFSKACLSQIYPTITNSCDKCHTSSCNLSHMYYSWQLLSSFWQSYFVTMSKILSIKIKVSPHIVNIWVLRKLQPLHLQVVRNSGFHFFKCKMPSSSSLEVH